MPQELVPIHPAVPPARIPIGQPVACMLLDENGLIQSYDTQAEALFGFSHGEALAQSITDLLPALAVPLMDETQAVSRTCRLEARRKDGAWVPVEATFSRVSRNASSCWIATVRDRSREASEQNHLLQAIVESSGEAIYVKDRQGRYLMINSAGARVIDKPIHEIIGKSDCDLEWSDRTHFTMVQDRRIMASGESFTYEDTEMSGGRPRTWLSTKGAYRDAQGVVVGLVGISRDISARKQVEEALRESEARKAAILETALDCIISINARGEIVEWNPAAEKTFGYAREEALGCDMAGLIVPLRLRDGHYDGVSHFLATGEEPVLNTRIEVPALRRDGSEFTAELTVTAIPGQSSHTFTIYLRDITERTQAADARRESEARYGRIATNVPGMVYQFVLRADGSAVFPYVSEGCRELYELEPEQIHQNTASVISTIHPEDQDSFHGTVAASAQSLQAWNWEGRIITPSGKQKWIQGASRPERLANGDTVWDGLLLDITERKQAEEVLRRLSLVASKTTNGVVITDAQGRAEWINEGFTHITGYSLEEMQDKKPGSLLQGPYTDPATVAAMRVALQNGEGFAVDIINYHKAGYPYWIHVDVTPIFDQQGRITQFIAIETDVTERKQAEDALRRAHDGLERRVEERTAELARAEEKYRTIYENSIEGIFQTTPDGSYLSANPALARIYGYENSEELRRALTRIDRQLYVDPSRRSEFADQMKSQGMISEFESQVYRKDGSIVWISEAARSVRDEFGALLYYEGAVTDITERKRAAEALRDSEGRYRNLVESSPEGIVVYCDSKLVYVNAAVVELLRAQTPADLLGRSVFDFVHPDFHAATRERARRSQQEGKSSGLAHLKYVRLDGTVLDVETVSTSVVYQGKPAGQVLIRDITERKQAEAEIFSLNAQLERRVQRLAVLRDIDSAIMGSSDLCGTLQVIADQVREQLSVDGAAVLLCDPSARRLGYAVGSGLEASSLPRLRQPLDFGHAGQAARQGRIVYVPDLKQTPDVFEYALAMKAEEFVSYWAVPLVVKGQIKGVLEIFSRRSRLPDAEWHDFLATLAGQAAIAIDNLTLFDDLARSNHQLTQAYDATIEGLSRALDLRDEETEGHSRRVTELTLRLASGLGLSEAQLVQIRRGALLHDIGKMGIPDRILLKPGKLTDEEWEIMRRHPTYALEMLSPIAFLQPALDIPYCHHEKWDGTGYPRGLKDEEIPLSARLFAIVDVWDALRSDRPYRLAWPVSKVREHLRSLSGTHFDPHVVDIFLEIIAEEAELSLAA